MTRGNDSGRLRPAEKAGSWYSADPQHLQRDLENYLKASPPTGARRCAGAVVPHAGLAYSGACAAKAYAWLAEANADTQTFIIFGAVHTMHLVRPAVWARGAWETPLGAIAVDEELAAALVQKGAARENERPHYGDNAIEMQMPFLRHVFPAARVLPVAVPPTPAAVDVGIAAWEAAQTLQRRAVTIGSSDLTHYGSAFGLTPAGFGRPAVKWCRKNDEAIIRLMGEMRAEEVVPGARERRNACGAGAIAATTAYARACGCDHGVLLEQTTSHEIMPAREARHIVGYCAMVFPLP